MKTILVADDEFDMTSTLRAILEGEGYQVETCGDGREALERALALRPDLVLLDVMMHVVSGFEVLQAMRRCPELRQVPVVLMSAIRLGVRSQEFEWQAFLPKPFSIDSLIKTVEQFLGKPAPAPDGGAG